MPRRRSERPGHFGARFRRSAEQRSRVVGVGHGVAAGCRTVVDGSGNVVVGWTKHHDASRRRRRIDASREPVGRHADARRRSEPRQRPSFPIGIGIGAGARRWRLGGSHTGRRDRYWSRASGVVGGVRPTSDRGDLRALPAPARARSGTHPLSRRAAQRELARGCKQRAAHPRSRARRARDDHRSQRCRSRRIRAGAGHLGRSLPDHRSAQRRPTAGPAARPDADGRSRQALTAQWIRLPGAGDPGRAGTGGARPEDPGCVGRAGHTPCLPPRDVGRAGARHGGHRRQRPDRA